MLKHDLGNFPREHDFATVIEYLRAREDHVENMKAELRQMRMARPARCSKPIYDLITKFLGER